MTRLHPKALWRSMAFEQLSSIYDEELALKLLRFGRKPASLSDLPTDLLPDEYSDITEYVEGLWQTYLSVLTDLDLQFSELRMLPNRRTFAANVVANHRHAVLFAMLDDKPYEHMIWRELEPVGPSPSRSSDE